MKKVIFILFTLIALITSCVKEEASAPKSGGVVNSHLIIEGNRYAVNFDVINTGDIVIKTVQVPFKIYFKSGTSEQRTAYITINLSPGESITDINAVITPPNQNPYNPRWIDFTGEIANYKFLTPIFTY